MSRKIRKAVASTLALAMMAGNAGRLFGVDAVAYCDDSIEIVDVDELCLFLANHRSMGSGCFHFGNYHFFVQFAIGKDILQVL